MPLTRRRILRDLAPHSFNCQVVTFAADLTVNSPEPLTWSVCSAGPNCCGHVKGFVEDFFALGPEHIHWIYAMTLSDQWSGIVRLLVDAIANESDKALQFPEHHIIDDPRDSPHSFGERLHTTDLRVAWSTTGGRWKSQHSGNDLRSNAFVTLPWAALYWHNP